MLREDGHEGMPARKREWDLGHQGDIELVLRQFLPVR
jgi:hypothetical protein